MVMMMMMMMNDDDDDDDDSQNAGGEKFIAGIKLWRWWAGTWPRTTPVYCSMQSAYRRLSTIGNCSYMQ